MSIEPILEKFSGDVHPWTPHCWKQEWQERREHYFEMLKEEIAGVGDS